MTALRVAVVMGGVSPERLVSIESGRVVLRHLHGPQHRVRPLVIDADGAVRTGREILGQHDLDRFDADKGLPDGSPLLVDRQTALEAFTRLVRDGIDVAFLALHGAGGEDGSIQGFLEWAGIPYTGAGVAASVLALDKGVFKALLLQHGLPAAPSVTFASAEWKADRAAVLRRGHAAAGVPCVVKAADLGSSFGVTIVKDESGLGAAIDSAAALSARVLWERYVRGTELTCPVLGHHAGELVALPVIEIVPKRGEFFDYESKYSAGGAEEICPARVPEAVTRRMSELSMAVHRMIGCEGVSRTDAILADGELVVLETNTIPGMTAASLLPKSAKTYGWSLSELFARMARQALERRAPRRGGSV
jgi:D-alanine-D-alanine ligase